MINPITKILQMRARYQFIQRLKEKWKGSRLLTVRYIPYTKVSKTGGNKYTNYKKAYFELV